MNKSQNISLNIILIGSIIALFLILGLVTVTLAGKLGIDLPFFYTPTPLGGLIFSVSLSFLGTYLCKHIIDWSDFRDTRNKLDEVKKKFREVKRKMGKKKGKKKRKLESISREAKKDQNKIWIFSIKQAILYLILFVPGWIGLGYGNGFIINIPFNLPVIGDSLGYFGFFLLTYLILAYIWRIILIPKI